MTNYRDIELLEIPFDVDSVEAQLMENIRVSMRIHYELFNRISTGKNKSSATLVQLLEDVANVYLDYSESLAKNSHLRQVK